MTKCKLICSTLFSCLLFLFNFFTITSQIPDSYHYKPRTQLYETMVKYETKEVGVDTADLGGDEETWIRDEAATTLLGYAEIEVMGHKVSKKGHVRFSYDWNVLDF